MKTKIFLNISTTIMFLFIIFFNKNFFTSSAYKFLVCYFIFFEIISIISIVHEYKVMSYKYRRLFKLFYNPIPKYLILVGVILLISVILMALSFFIDNILSNYLMGISTGLLSGLVLLLVTGTKSNELKRIQIINDTINTCANSLRNINYIYSSIHFHTFYPEGTKGISYKYYKNIMSTHQKFFKENIDILVNIDISLIPTKIKQDYNDIMNILQDRLKISDELLSNTSINQDEIIMNKDMASLILSKIDLINDSLSAYKTSINKMILTSDRFPI